ncbi:MAG: protocatechuate 3,4-dioxygenase subunit alpha [Candidatus Dormibacterales bacterium]
MSGRPATPSQTLGPFFGFALAQATGADPCSVPGALRIEGQVLDGDREPVSDALLELWEGEVFARCRTDVEGAFHFTVARPAGGGPGGASPHLNLAVFARGLLRHVVTRIYLPEEAANARDPVLALVEEGRRETLIARREGAVLRFDVRLQGEAETVFFEL